MLRLVLTLLKHRVTWRVVMVLLATIGYSCLNEDLSGLETLVCSVLTCVD